MPRLNTWLPPVRCPNDQWCQSAGGVLGGVDLCSLCWRKVAMAAL